MRRVLGPILMGTLVLGSQLSGCFEGGANFNQQTPGNNDEGGVNLGDGEGSSTWTEGDNGETVLHSYGAVAVAPDGSYFLSAAGGKLIFGDLELGQSELVGGVGTPSRVAFGDDAPRFYLSSSTA